MTFSYDKKVGKKIKGFRDARGWSQEELVAHLQTEGCDITRSALAKIEVGQRHIYLQEIKAFKTALQVSYDELLD